MRFLFISTTINNGCFYSTLYCMGLWTFLFCWTTFQKKKTIFVFFFSVFPVQRGCLLQNMQLKTQIYCFESFNTKLMWKQRHIQSTMATNHIHTNESKHKNVDIMRYTEEFSSAKFYCVAINMLENFEKP